MIHHAAKCVGKDSSLIIAYIEDDVYLDEAAELYTFIEWLIEQDIPFTEDKLESIYQEYKSYKT